MRSVFIGISLLGIILCVGLVILLHKLTAPYFVIRSYNAPSVIFPEGPKSYFKNKHVDYTVNKTADVYNIHFRFEDHQNRERVWKWSYVASSTNDAILKFGVPNAMFQAFIPTDSAIRVRKAFVASGMFKKEGNYIVPDISAMIRYYGPYLTPIRRAINDVKEEYNSRRAQLELLIKFCQDIPYGVPPNSINNKYIAGLMPPPQVFVNGWGDCDSKALIFAATSLNFDRTEVLFLYESGHLLVAVNGIPKPYDDFYDYQNKQYIVADVSGPGRSDLGQVSDPYRNFSKVVLFKNTSETQGK